MGFWNALNPRFEYTIHSDLSADEIRQLLRDRSTPQVRSFRLSPLFTSAAEEKPFILASDKAEMKLYLLVKEQEGGYAAPIRIRCEPAGDGTVVHVRIGQSFLAGYGILIVFCALFAAVFIATHDARPSSEKWLIWPGFIFFAVFFVHYYVEGAPSYKYWVEKAIKKVLTRPKDAHLDGWMEDEEQD